MKIIKAQAEHSQDVARLFDLYRQFYQCPADLALAERFISERIERDESVIFMAKDPDQEKARGFVQLYPSFCSVDAVKIFILYDLYVDAPGRKLGTGKKLMQKAASFAKEAGAARLDLLTAHDNLAGQALYEKQDYQKVNEDFYAYSLSL